MRLTWTDAGYAALTNAANDGLSGVRVAAVALGSGSEPADKSRTALAAEHTRLSTISGMATAPNIIHVTVRDETDATYTAREIGLIADDAAGTLLAIYAQDAAIVEKAAQSTLFLPIDAILTDVDATQITFGNADIVNPLATETTPGIVQRASAELTRQGSDDRQYTTPAAVFAAVGRWLKSPTPGDSYPINISGRADSASNADTVGNETPAQLHNADNLTGTAPRGVLPLATATLAGAVRRASTNLAAGGTDDAQYVTAAGVRAAIASWLDRDTPSDSYPISIGGKAARAGDADTVDGKNASDFAPAGGDPDEFWKVRTATGDNNAVNNERLREAINLAKRELHPVGNIFLITGDSRNPREILGFGRWEKWAEGKALVGAGTNGAGSTYGDGDTFGQETVALNPDQIPPVEVDVPRTTFAATYNGNAFRSDSGDQQGYLTLETKGGGQAHENRQPSQVQYAWRRTA